MKKFILTVAFFYLSACGHFKKDNHEKIKEHTPETLQLQSLYEEKLAKTSFDELTGWPAAEDCDATLWAGIAKAAGVSTVNLSLAEYEPGRIERRPYKSCYPGESASTVSKDMILGYLWGMWVEGNMDAVGRLASYGEAHEFKIGGELVGWIMGRPYPEMASRVVLTPNLIGITGRMLYAMSEGSIRKTYRKITPVFLPVEKDYEKHLQVLAILLDGEVGGGDEFGLSISDQARVQLITIADENPGDALFQAAQGAYTGHYDEAIRLLLDEAYEYPSYVRGAENYKIVHWLFAANEVLKRHF